MNATEKFLTTVWAMASKITGDETLCRARWVYAMKRIEAVRREVTDPDLDTAWDVAVWHAYDYSRSPLGYTGQVK